jgi:hypothetical protein
MSGDMISLDVESDITNISFLNKVKECYNGISLKVIRVIRQEIQDIDNYIEILENDEMLYEKICQKEGEVFYMIINNISYSVHINLSSSEVFDIENDNERYNLYDIALISHLNEETFTTIQGIYVRSDHILDKDNKDIKDIEYYLEDFDSIPSYQTRNGWEIEISPDIKNIKNSLLELVYVSKLGNELKHHEKEEVAQMIWSEWKRVFNSSLI